MLLVIIIAAVICFYFVKKSKNRKAAQSGEDMERVRKSASPLLDGFGNHQVLYAHWEKRESYGRTVRTTFYRYVIAYQDQTLYVAPLQIDKKTRNIQAGRFSVIPPENLGKVTVKTKQKNGSADHMEIWFCDKQGKELFQLYVDAENLRKSRWFPVNIVQQEACDAFAGFITAFAQRVDAENPGIDDVINANATEGAGILGAVVSVIGAVLALFLPPLGILVSLIGLIMSVVSKAKGAKVGKALIICIICVIWSAAFLITFLEYYI